MWREAAIFISDRVLALAPDAMLTRAARGDMWSRLAHLRDTGFAPRQIVDIGAYEGTWTTRCAKLFPQAHFLMLEAQDAKAAALGEVRGRMNGRADYTIGVLSAEAGAEVTFFEMETGSSYLEELTDAPRRSVQKVTTTLNDVLRSAGIATVDFMKLDVQGAELDVLRGGLDALRSAQYVLMEVAISDYNRGAPNAGEVISFMTGHGFAIRDIADVKRRGRGGPVNQMDILFARS